MCSKDELDSQAEVKLERRTNVRNQNNKREVFNEDATSEVDSDSIIYKIYDVVAEIKTNYQTSDKDYFTSFKEAYKHQVILNFMRELTAEQLDKLKLLFMCEGCCSSKDYSLSGLQVLNFLEFISDNKDTILSLYSVLERAEEAEHSH